MIKVFSGSDRAKIANEVKKILGENYEVFDSENLKVEDIINIFTGTSLFATKRKILIKDLAELNSESVDVYAEVAKYAKTPHDIVIWETKLTQKKSYKDFVKLPGVEVKKIDLVQKIDMRKVFDIFDTAMNDGARAVKMLEEVQGEEDPYMFFGLLASQAIKKFEWRQGAREKRILKELSKLDIQMKSTAVEPWLLIKGFLLRLASL
ncbi:hypothetical protein IKW75_01970 [Candidatus Saccharibacteria bacterium]|nr:hypothetical protein [Candidatus Saccharibacteria bacterium]